MTQRIEVRGFFLSADREDLWHKDCQDPRRRGLLRKRITLLSILPNLFTVSSIFCGLYAIIQATDGTAADRFYLASVDFGLQMDSLADVISFGVAPAILVYQWGLTHFGLVGMLVAFAYAVCGALRLARFNVLAAANMGTSKHFVGLPIPLAAAGIVSLVLLHFKMGGVQLGYQPLLIVVMVLLALLMVSNIRYRTFKELRGTRFAAPAIVVLTLVIAVAIWQTSFSLILATVCTTLIALGPAEELVRFVRRRFHRREEEEEEETV
jgi:CDP-diacylglycerol--serine O-phosphatidyltransferase